MCNANIYKAYWILLIALCGSFYSCNKHLEVHLKSEWNKTESIDWQVGTGSEKITAPPGYPMGGYGAEGRYGRGYWNHLYAKSLYIEDPNGQSFVITSCDLWSVSGGLADKVIEKLQQSDDPRHHLNRAQLILTATHTHNSQASFSSSSIYNSLSGIEDGFSQSLFDFTVDQICASIKQSIEDKQPSSLYTVHTDLQGLIRNRSIEAFWENPSNLQNEINDGTIDGTDYIDDHRLPSFVRHAEEFESVKSLATTLLIQDLKGNITCVANFMALHPTILGNHTEVYTSDIFGKISLILSKKYPQAEIINIQGAEGDISANWYNQDLPDTYRISHDIAQKIDFSIRNGQKQRVATKEITLAFADCPLRNVEVDEEFLDKSAFCEHNLPMKTAKKPYPGTPILGGAEDGRTAFYHKGFREGIRSHDCTGSHANKIEGFGPAAKELFDLDRTGILPFFFSTAFRKTVEDTTPRSVPLGLYSIGNLTLATFPGECTTALGHRITKTIAKYDESTEDASKVIIIGLANDYLSYFTTEHEYMLQHYEGASTVYGYASGGAIEQHYATLSKKSNSYIDYPDHKEYNVGFAFRGKFRDQCDKDAWISRESLANFLIDTSSFLPLRLYPEFHFDIEKLGFGEYPTIAIEYLDDDSQLYQALHINDRYGYTEIQNSDSCSNFIFGLQQCEVTENKDRYFVIFLAPQNMDKSVTLRYKVDIKQQTIYSESFTLHSGEKIYEDKM